MRPIPFFDVEENERALAAAVSSANRDVKVFFRSRVDLE
jgi:hypothetical protein